jgi:hypothetical protein
MNERSVSAAVVGGAVLAVLGCGGGPEQAPPARPEASLLNWSEARGTPGERLIVRVASITLRRGAWSVSASIENDTAAPLFIGRPHTDDPGTFGLVAADSTRKRGALPGGLTATHYSPPLPGVLDPGERWRGTFSGPGAIRSGTNIQITFGSFWAYGGVWIDGRRHMLFRVVTDHSVTLR